MRIAVCISGAFNTKRTSGNLVRNIEVLKSKFPTADFYYATWESFKPKFEKTLPNDGCEYFPEPTMHYHPYDIPKEDHVCEYYQSVADWVKKGGAKRRDWTSHHTKQILIHSWLIDRIPKEYDIIVRTRFDAYVVENADFGPFLDDTLTHHRANCFATRKSELLNKLQTINSDDWAGRLLDHLIIHNADAIDTNNVYSLHENKKLHAAEFGWYQVISMPHGSKHRNHAGWVNPDWSILDKFYKG